MTKRLVPFLILGIMLLNLIPSPAYAATLARAVAAEGHYTMGTYVGGALDFTNLNLDDGDTTYIRFPDAYTGEPKHSYEMVDFVTANNGIDYVTLQVTARTEEIDETVTLVPFVRIGGIDYLGLQWTFDTGIYEDEFYSWYLNPATGVAWVIDDLDDTVDGDKAEFGFYRTSLFESRVTFMELVVTYTAIGFTSVSTIAPTGITDVAATFNGDVTDDGGQVVTNRGFVWGTTSVPVNPGNVVPAASGYANNWLAGAGNYGENPYTYAAAVLVQGTIYYIRACAQNASGWTYGDQLSFTTLDDPIITTNDATYIDQSTARLNAYLDNSGGAACTVSFAWALTTGGPYANWAAVVAGGTSGDAAGTWITGQSPYLDITGLDSARDYTFMVRAVNVVSTQYGAQLTFQADAYIDPPTEFRAIPGSNDVALSWVLGDGATNTEVRYKLGDYPTATIIGANGVHFVGSDPNSYINCGAIHNASVQMWVSFWFRLNDDWEVHVGAVDHLWSKNIGGFPTNYMMLRFDNADGKLYWRKNVVGANVFNLAADDAGGADITSWNAGQWYHVYAAISNAAGHNQARFHVRTIGDAGTLVTDPDITAAPNGGNFLMGNNFIGDVLGFEGVLADFYCGTADITLADEVALYGTGLPYTGVAPAVYHDYWALDEGEGTTAEDTGTTPGDDGTLGSSCTWYDIVMSLGGTLVYFDDGASITHTGLTPGTTYYYSAWGESGGFYSDGYATAMATTLAYVPPDGDMPTPPTPSTWFSAPDYTTMANVPFYDMVNWWADTFEMPRSTVWYIIAMIIVTGAGVWAYAGLANHNVVMASVVVGVAITMFSFMKLIPLWQLLPFGIIVAVGLIVGERR